MTKSVRRASKSRRLRPKAKTGTRTSTLMLSETFASVWRQVLVDGQSEVALGRRRYAVEFTRRKQLRSVAFTYLRRRFFGIEQNPDTGSRWATLARKGKPVMQFRFDGRYVANVSEGKVFRYPAWRALKLPE
jgi:hypothetical protein